MSDPLAIEALVAEAVDRHGRIDILVNNAGVNTLDHRVDIDEFPQEEWDRILGIDLDGLFDMSRAALPAMLRSGGGRVVNIASVVGLAAMRLQSPFVAAKAGVIHLTRAMALELASKGILVNAIAPGSVLTDLTRELFYGQSGQFSMRTREFMAHVPLGRPGEPGEIAEAALFLVSPEASYINGQVLAVDGGWTSGFMM
jgi:3-oxoacyl-[acyl-carrier protein] reductase/2-deoxy-D-gluconate 3-dehydrogenase